MEAYPSEKWYRENYPDGPYDGHEGWGQAPDDWMERLDALQIKWACSPLHHLDVDDNGRPKKPHWHIVICYSGKKSFEQVKDDIAELKGPIPQVCRDVRSSVRYLIHRDHPHKYQYNRTDIKSFGGFDVDDFFKFSTSEVSFFTMEMADFVYDNNITEFCDFDEICRKEHPDTWYRVLCGNTNYFKTLITSLRHKTEELVKKGRDKV